MKYGIITFHRAENFGSVLQAWALSRFVKNQDNEAQVIDFDYQYDSKQYRLFRRHLYIKRPQAFIGDLLYLKYNKSRKQKFTEFRSRYLNMTEKTYVYEKNVDEMKELNEQFDGFICGSDQIWNVNCTGVVIPPYFLSFADEKKRKIAYAPSMPSKIESRFHEEVRERVERLDHISVREAGTVSYLKSVCKVSKEITYVVDPTLLIDADAYIKEFGLNQRISEDNTLFIYLLGDNKDIIGQIVEEALHLKEEYGCKIRYIYRRKIKAFKTEEYALGLGPADFLSEIRNARFILTDSFHATVFSMIFKKKFGVYSRPGSESRMISLLESLNLAGNFIPLGSTIDWISNEYPEDFDNRWKSITAHSKKYLIEALNHE